jgi:hypothetical protein
MSSLNALTGKIAEITNKKLHHHLSTTKSTYPHAFNVLKNANQSSRNLHGVEEFQAETLSVQILFTVVIDIAIGSGERLTRRAAQY